MLGIPFPKPTATAPQGAVFESLQLIKGRNIHGKAKKQLPPPKDHQLTIRLTKDLYDVLTADAAAAGLPRTEYIRQLITNRKPVIKQEVVFNDPEILRIFRNLGHYGANLNQIARYLNQGGTITNQIWKDIRECIAEIHNIRDAVKEMAGEYRGSH